MLQKDKIIGSHKEEEPSGGVKVERVDVILIKKNSVH